MSLMQSPPAAISSTMLSDLGAALLYRANPLEISLTSLDGVAKGGHGGRPQR
jgi:hypothetical protein